MLQGGEPPDHPLQGGKRWGVDALWLRHALGHGGVERLGVGAAEVVLLQSPQRARVHKQSAAALEVRYGLCLIRAACLGIEHDTGQDVTAEEKEQHALDGARYAALLLRLADAGLHKGLARVHPARGQPVERLTAAEARGLVHQQEAAIGRPPAHHPSEGVEGREDGLAGRRRPVLVVQVHVEVGFWQRGGRLCADWAARRPRVGVRLHGVVQGQVQVQRALDHAPHAADVAGQGPRVDGL
mmetsp:Transcript_80096/g.248576  ORF Transcript_80096/g.248576 Transcript_80096/m.248576 type:complete len:241 (+) Transcript_80096:72-794(+)